MKTRPSSHISCVRVISSPNVSRSVGRSAPYIVGKIALDIGGRAVLKIIGKPRSENRFVQAARIIERTRCNMIILNISQANPCICTGSDA